ncbi:hypothetical protein IQ270_19970 [Microcoleus sp. LEGE 07076]|uniref:hypothetical protein n=1 Tax=Microcoleus sp. LEGE 07076 TaxID=915322 RepID=UPI00187FC843|nr:hypothetical protein [Microcoleus sp. LEGE 07076]MBE9186872.1 hypothetical protein [Microcoleus sp. LEGE 07076]
MKRSYREHEAPLSCDALTQGCDRSSVYWRARFGDRAIGIFFYYQLIIFVSKLINN